MYAIHVCQVSDTDKLNTAVLFMHILLQFQSENIAIKAEQSCRMYSMCDRSSEEGAVQNLTEMIGILTIMQTDHRPAAL